VGTRDDGPDARSILVLTALAAIALGVRALWMPDAVGADDRILFPVADASYHARRALWSFARFPEVLTFDSYLSFPDGAVVPMPPLYDWLLAAVARALGSDERTFEWVAAWASPTAAALTVPLVYGIARSLTGRGTALLAAGLFAVLPAGVDFATFGDADHHAFVALLGSAELLCILALASPAPAAPRVAMLSLALLALRVVLALAWSGSLLYLGLGEALLLGVALASRARARLLAGQGAGAAGAAALLAPWVAGAPTPPGGAFSTLTLSWFHVAALAAAGTAALLLLSAHAALRVVPERRLRALAPLALAGVVAVAIAAFLARDALGPAVAFLAKADDYGARSLEQRPLFRWPFLAGDVPTGRVTDLLGGFAYLVPVAWLAPLLFATGATLARRGALAAWLLVFGALCALQVRFASDFGPSACAAFALALDGVPGALGLRGAARAAVCGALGAALLGPGLAHAAAWPARLSPAWAYLRDGRAAGHPARATWFAFADRVRGATPESAGYLDPAGRPEYAVLCRPAFGHGLLYGARRATPAGNFGPYLGREKFLDARRFYEVRSEAEALGISRSLGARYVMTTERGAPTAQHFVDRLHVDDGSARAEGPHAERFRLVTEAPPGGKAFPFEPVGPGPRSGILYKLFERVEGARLVVEAAPGTPVHARATITAQTGRRFHFEAAGSASDGGVAELRVPYATEPAGAAAFAEAPYQVAAGGASGAARVAEADVAEGREVRVRLTR
jgi:asparagine N-glycosylation enzyme membrane subunit Stt3